MVGVRSRVPNASLFQRDLKSNCNYINSFYRFVG